MGVIVILPVSRGNADSNRTLALKAGCSEKEET